MTNSSKTSFLLGGIGPAMFQKNFPELKARVIPVLVRPDGSYVNDSTPLILELDKTFPDRKLLPEAPGMAFISALIEDFCDEWMTKVMFEGRFHTQREAAFGAKWQFWQSPSGLTNPAQAAKEAEDFAARQVGQARGQPVSGACFRWRRLVGSSRK